LGINLGCGYISVSHYIGKRVQLRATGPAMWAARPAPGVATI
jgi:hypothetical protein